jgi:acid ceramidase/N-acylethanolamine-hydrolysing acid amidase
VVSGTNGNEGAVIERDSDKVHGFYELSATNWFLVQTNYDRDLPDPVHDQRRIPAEKRLKERGNKNLN